MMSYVIQISGSNGARSIKVQNAHTWLAKALMIAICHPNVISDISMPCLTDSRWNEISERC